jgi:hypothetical protein
LVDSHQVFYLLLNYLSLDLFLFAFCRRVNSSLFRFGLLRLLFFGRGFFNDLRHGLSFFLFGFSWLGFRLRHRLGLSGLDFFSRSSFSLRSFGLNLFSWRVLSGSNLLSLGFFLRFIFSVITH